MRLALLCETYPPVVGGLAVSVARLARGLQEAGHEVELFTLAGGERAGQLDTQAEAALLVHRLAPLRRHDETMAAWFEALVARHQQAPFALLHGYFLPRAGFLATYAGHYLGVPSVASARGNDLDRALFDPAKAAPILHALHHASALTANARSLQRKAEALAPGRRVTLIPNGVDGALFSPGPPDPALAAQLGLDDSPVLAFVGEARAKKGLAPLLLAFRTLAQRRPLTLLLVGGVRKGEDRDLVRLFQAQNPTLRLSVLPAQPLMTMPAYYRLLDLLVLPSFHDGLPNALLEGMACGCAIVATPVGGIPDALRDGEQGCLVPPGDVAALVSAIEALLDDPERRAQLGQAARAHALATFPLAAEVRDHEALYHSLLTNRS